MKRILYTILIPFLLCQCSDKVEDIEENGSVDIQSFGVLSTNTPEQNKVNLQKAIDWASQKGAQLDVTPVEGGYPMAGGLVLKKNVSLVGVHGPTGRGTVATLNGRKVPTGSLFVITDKNNDFITVESATQIKGIQFYYPEQAYSNKDKIIEYPATIKMSSSGIVEGVTLSCLTFYGEYIAMDFASPGGNVCEQILFEHCYGYPLSGEFIKIDKCYDIPRILHCHVNPANAREFDCSFTKDIIDYVVAKKNFTYWIDHTDNAQMMDVFTFGVYGGIYLGDETYGQLTNFNLDCVTVGIHKLGSNTKNRNWQISQGSIIANTGENVESIHPIIVEGQGHTAISNVECFSGINSALTCIGSSYDYMTVRGNDVLTISAVGCRMQGYVASNPFTILNPNARIQVVACVDKDEKFINWEIN